ncbi:MAG: DNA alkylation repair protein, partial [Hydrogenovibrio sp.]|nr:DNA alkylation repair protein [Hydrogenovibrio sp.]
GFSGFEYIFFPDFIEAFGCHPSYIDASLTALEIMTEHSSAEFAIRPFLERFPEQTWGQLQRWAQSPNEHHRRLASEGSRPRLPWARRLSVFSDPTQRLPILEQLKRDESPYVRKSVANHLNDLGKDHPDWLLSIAHEWLGQHPHTDWIVKHACRNLLKQSNPKALRLFGYRATPDIELEALICSPTVSLGDTLAFAFTLQTRAQKLGRLRIEFAIDYVKANGKWSPKRFKLAEGEYPTNLRHFEKQLLFKPLTTRRHYPGTHRLSIIVNGEVKASATFDLKIPKRQKTKVSH